MRTKQVWVMEEKKKKTVDNDGKNYETVGDRKDRLSYLNGILKLFYSSNSFSS